MPLANCGSQGTISEHVVQLETPFHFCARRMGQVCQINERAELSGGLSLDARGLLHENCGIGPEYFR
jgi:hypothetical protein